MKRNPATTLVLIVLLLLLPPQAWAECAWVLWSSEKKGESWPTSSTWSIEGAHETKDDCWKHLLRRVSAARFANPAFAGDVDGIVIVTEEKVPHGAKAIKDHELQVQCLPDTIGPRRPKGSGR